MHINEIYSSLQGEGLLAGTPSAFVRITGCNLRCHWCDTPFTSWEPSGTHMTIPEILRVVEKQEHRHVVVTGGEPLLFNETVALCDQLRRQRYHVTIETAGTVIPQSFEDQLLADLLSISPKLSSSSPTKNMSVSWAKRHQSSRRQDNVLQALLASGPWQIKFVIETQEDLGEADAWIHDLRLQHQDGVIFMMPQGTSKEHLHRTTAWLSNACKQRGYRLAHRHHIEWFGNTRGT
ncbi:MAG: 7-carboxy-7-deazaguanine synthase QueE [Pirellulales bacterium]